MSAFSNRPFDILSMLLGGRLNSPQGVRQFWPGDSTDATSWTGLTWSNLYSCQESATPVVDLIGSSNLAANGSPLYEQATDFSDRNAIVFPAGSNSVQGDYFNDDDTTSRAFLTVVDIPDTIAANFGILGRCNATAAGYSVLALTTGNLQFRRYDSSTLVSANLAFDHRGYLGPLAFVMDYTAQTASVHTLLGSASADISAQGSAAQAAQVFHLGRAVGLANAGGQGNLLLLHGTGAGVEGVDWATLLSDIWVGP